MAKRRAYAIGVLLAILVLVGVSALAWIIVDWVRDSRVTKPLAAQGRVALLLTAAVQPVTEGHADPAAAAQTRRAWYERTIRYYLEHTNLPVLVVESTGHTFDIEHERLRQHVLAIRTSLGNSTTRLEVASVQSAWRAGLMDGFDMVVKVTGKYVLPELEAELVKMPPGTAIVYQNKHAAGWQNCEVFGFWTNMFESIYTDACLQEKLMEVCLSDVHERLGVQAHRLPPLQVAYPVPRTDGTQLAVL